MEKPPKKKPGIKRIRPDEKKACVCIRIYPSDKEAVSAKYGTVQQFLDYALSLEIDNAALNSSDKVKV